MSNIESPQPIGPIRGPEEIAAPQVSKGTEPDSGASTIEKSKLVATLLTPLLSSMPLLAPPMKEAETVEGLSSILDTMYERQKMSFLFSFVAQMNETVDKMNKNFAENLEAIREEIERIIKSPAYREKEEIRRREGVGEVSRTASSSVEPLGDEIRSDSIERLNQLSRDFQAQANLEIPFTVLFTVAGGLALGKMESKNDAVDDVAKLVVKLQPLVPQVKQEEILPLINLMVMAPIIFRPLDEQMGNSKANEQKNYAKLVQNFAKDVIKMVTDPTFALLSIVNNIERVDHLNAKQKAQLIAMLKLILSSVALSLLHSLEVGKIQGGKFFGMEPIEFRALLDPHKPLLQPKPEEQMNTQEKLIWSLIHLIRIQMVELPSESISSTIDHVLEFLSQSQRVDKLLDPSKVLMQVFQSMNYKLPTPNPLYA